MTIVAASTLSAPSISSGLCPAGDVRAGPRPHLLHHHCLRSCPAGKNPWRRSARPKLHTSFSGVRHSRCDSRHVAQGRAVRAIDTDGIAAGSRCARNPSRCRRRRSMTIRLPSAPQSSPCRTGHLVAKLLRLLAVKVVDGVARCTLARHPSARSGRETCTTPVAMNDESCLPRCASKLDVFATFAVFSTKFTPAVFELPVANASTYVLLQLKRGCRRPSRPPDLVCSGRSKGDCKPARRQHVGGRRPARGRPDDADRSGRSIEGAHGLDPACPRCVGQVFLDETDGDGAVARLLDDHCPRRAGPAADAAADISGKVLVAWLRS